MQVEPGSIVQLDEVLLVADEGSVVVGAPFVGGAKVLAKAMGEVRGAKVIVFKYKRKTRYRRKTGHRQNYTNLVITDIVSDHKQ